MPAAVHSSLMEMLYMGFVRSSSRNARRISIVVSLVRWSFFS